MGLYSFQTIMELEPEEILNFFIAELREDAFTITSVDTEDEKKRSAEMLNKMASYNSYFGEMRQMAKLCKRQMKLGQEKREIIDKALGMEEVFETLSSFCENQISVITKIMTLKRMELDEMKMNI